MRKESRSRRYAVLAEGRFTDSHAKTSHGFIRYGRDEISCVIDSTLAGKRISDVMPELERDAPIVSTLEEALEHSPDSILVGLAPAGGRVPPEWVELLRKASDAGLEVVSGLHQRVAPLLGESAKVWEVREPPEDLSIFTGRGFDVESKVVATVGTDAAVGKMTATLEIERAARIAGLSTEFVATGQTGMVVSGWGICVDAVISDFIAGAAESLVLEAAKSSPDMILVEGQGSLGHPAYSGVTVGLLHGSCPDALVLCADASGEEVYAGVPRPDAARAVRLYEEVAALVKPAPVVAVSVNTRGLGDEESLEFVQKISSETGLPAADPFRHDMTEVLKAIESVAKARPASVINQQ